MMDAVESRGKKGLECTAAESPTDIPIFMTSHMCIICAIFIYYIGFMGGGQTGYK